MMAIRGEISSLNKKLMINQTNLQECVEKLNQARNYQQQVGELSPIFKGTMMGFTMWLSLLILKEYSSKDGIPPFQLGKIGIIIMVMSLYLAFYEVINLRVNNGECKKSILEQNERQLTQQSQFLIALEAKLDASLKNNQINDEIEKINAFAKPTSISEYLLNQKEDKKEDKQVVSDQVDNEHDGELSFRAGAYKVEPELIKHLIECVFSFKSEKRKILPYINSSQIEFR